MSQDECSTEARMCTRRKPKEGTTRSGATAPTERHCADKAPVRQQGATHKGSKTRFPFCVVLKTYHPETWILHKTCLKHFNFLNRKTVCPIVSKWNIMATAMGQGTEELTNKLRQGSKTRQLQHVPSPDWARSTNCVQFFKSPDSAPSIGFAPFSQGFKSGGARKRGDCCIEPNCYEWNTCQHKLRKQEKQNKQGKTLREEREITTWITEHGST